MATQTANIVAKSRTQLGGRANKRLRESGELPAVIYGHKEAVVTISLPKKETEKHIHHGHLYDLSFDGKSEKVLIKEVQFDHLGIDVIHVDFARVSLDEKVEVTVPLTLKGTPKGEEEEGAVLQQIMAELEVECLVTEIPDSIIHDVTDMGKDTVLHIKDLKLPAGVKALADEDQIVATVREIEDETAEEGSEGSAEPEVIGKKEEAAEGEEAAK